MKVNRYVTRFVLLVTLLLAGQSVFAGTQPPRRPVPSPQVGAIPSWAVPSASPSRLDAFDAGDGPFEPGLLRALLEAEPDDVVPVVVTLREQVVVESAAVGELGVAETRSLVVSALQAGAARSQTALRAYLEGAQAAGQVEHYTPFWIFNGIAVRARPSVVQALAAHPSVAAVHLDHWRQWITEESPNPKFQNPNLQSAIRNLQSPLEWGVARIRADQVWSALRITGTGAVVAGMDTGVDWLHPALQANYRPFNPHGPTNHTHSWYDATGGGALYPIDDHGHGSHTLGTVVGQDGIGVAPGAGWIAVKALNNDGYAYDSWVHAGFQWLLAPGGNPAMVPDVVNCSWGSSISTLTTFQSDLRALRAAGIPVVFSAGNDGPGAGTTDSPASLPEAFAVGATDPADQVANFSGRGPSPWGEVRPHVVAPGVNVRSSLPGGAYDYKDGTSMAAPHVAGIVALLRSVSPTLGIDRATFIITSTTVPLGAAVPNNDSGWGRVDAFAAVATLVQPGFITGTVARAGDGMPLAGATVTAVPHEGGAAASAVAKDGGSYLLALSPDVYDLTASAFGHASATNWGVVVTAGTTTVADFSLSPLPSGILRGAVTDATTGHPITATVSVLDTPLETSDSSYTFTLPVGTYTLRARSPGHRLVTATAAVESGLVTVVDLALPPAPTILLVDSGPWYYSSQATYFRQALDDLAYAYDEWPITQLPDRVPTAADLIPYDVVVWSAPEDAPGYIGAEGVITGYLSAGGQMLLTGQDVGYWDGGGSFFYSSPYYRDYLKARYVDDDASSRVLDGTSGDLFAGWTITITGAGGADNQRLADQIAVADSDAAAPLWTYQGDGCGGLRVGTCLDYRAIYFSFGFEAINDRASRRGVMGRALDWLTSLPPTVALELEPISQARVGLPNSIVTHTLRVRHVGQRGVTDTVSLTLDGVSWPAQLSEPSLSLPPCSAANVVVSVTIPSSAGWNESDVITLTARSTVSPTIVETAVLTTKAPAPILLVDDERWYDEEDKYKAALADGGFSYDYWRTSGASGESGSAPLSSDVLQRYPIVVWFTGYDWYDPVTTAEEAMLAAYLDGGGRLFLSSQDFLYRHGIDPFARDYLGVVTYTEEVTATVIRGVPENAIGDWLGPYALTYPFSNWSDGLVPAPGTAVAFREQERLPIALARQAGEHKTVFFAFPFEALPEGGRTEVMERVVGWLSWLGGSTFTADRTAVADGDTLTYTAVLRNDGPEVVRSSLFNTLPLSLTLVPDSLTGPAVYHAPTRLLSWEGLLGPGAAITVTYQATATAGLFADGSGAIDEIVNSARLGLEDQGLHFRPSAVVRVGAPDLSPSAFQCGPSPSRPGTVVTCTLDLVNAGPGDAPGAVVTGLLPPDAPLVPRSLVWADVGAAEALSGTVRWSGALSAGSQVTLTYQLTLPTDPVHPPLYSVVFLEDGLGGAWERTTWLLLEPFEAYLPFVTRDG